MRNKTLITAFVLGFSSIATLAYADVDPKIARTYKAKCASCHGEDGKGATDQGKKQGVADMSTDAWQKKFTDAQVKEAIEKGVQETRGGVKKEMEAYATKLKPDQIDGLVAFVRTLKK